MQFQSTVNSRESQGTAAGQFRIDQGMTFVDYKINSNTNYL